MGDPIDNITGDARPRLFLLAFGLFGYGGYLYIKNWNDEGSPDGNLAKLLLVFGVLAFLLFLLLSVGTGRKRR